MEEAIKLLQNIVVKEVVDRTNESYKYSMIRHEQFNNLHVSAFMDIKKTTESLQHILEYKKEVAIKMLNCNNEKQLELYSDALKHAESLIKKVLGMCL